MGRDPDLEPVRRTFEAFGRRDPLYAALARRGCDDNRWDPDAFFATGRAEIRDVLAYVADLGLHPERNRALDFGCGVGRLTQALAEHFEEAVGVDIAASMVEKAREFLADAGPGVAGVRGRVRFLVNTTPDLALFEGASFDFVYSNKVLQHIPPEGQLAYVGEFVRLLRPRGVAVFQTKDGPAIRPGTVRARLYTLNRRVLRRLWQRIRGRAPYEMHYVARARVEGAVEEAGARVADVLDVGRPGRRRSLRYCVLSGRAAPRPAATRSDDARTSLRG